MAKLDGTYVNLIELPFEDDNLTVRLYWRAEDGRSRFLCRTKLPNQSIKDCCVYLTSLSVAEFCGPFLRFFWPDPSTGKSQVWAELKFLSYEGTCTKHLPIRLSI